MLCKNISNRFSLLRTPSRQVYSTNMETKGKRNNIENSNNQWTKHVGKYRLPAVLLPHNFDESAKLYLKEKDKTVLKTIAVKLSDFLISRRVCVTNERVARIPHLSEKAEVEKFFHEEHGCGKLHTPKFEKKTDPYMWKNVSYDELNSAAYLIARSPAVYAVTLRILTEIKKKCIDFSPQSLLDFGSGTGTTIWAANNLWMKHIKQYVCVDSSTEMNKLALHLFCGGNHNQHLPSIFIRQYLPISFQCNYDIVVSSYALSELPTEKDRIKMLKLLWAKTNRFLVIVEHGNFYGYYIIQEARNLFLKGLNSANSKKSHIWKGFKPNVKVFAPCPHEMDCPKWGGSKVCRFTQPYLVPSYAKRYMKSVECHEKYSYVVLDKMGEDFPRWPRVVEEPVKQNKCLHCHLCTSHGKIKHVGIAKAKHGSELRSVAKVSKPGDCWPFSDEYLNFEGS